MSEWQRIVIWDLSAERQRDKEINAKAAMRRLGLKAVVQLNSEALALLVRAYRAYSGGSGQRR